MDKKRIIKYFLQFVVIVLIGAGVFFGIGYYRYRTSPEYKKYQDLLALKERYMADTYGGDTPEETLELFIDALKAGDIDLASKYFVLDKREEISSNLLVGKQNGNIDKLLAFISRAKNGRNLDEDTYILTAVNEEKVAEFNIKLVRNLNNKWKLLEL